MAKKRKQFAGIRKENKTERNRLGTMVIRDKKKEENKKKCRGK